MMTKTLVPKLQLAHKSDAQLLEFTSQRINSLDENAAAFPGMTPTLAQLTATYNDFVAAVELCGKTGNPASTSAKNEKREKLCNTLTWCAQSCIEIVDGNQPLFELSGFSLKSRAQRISTINCPGDIKVTQGPFDGSVYCSFQSVEHARCYEVQYGSNPTSTSDWSTMFTSTSRKNMITELTPMSKGYMRIRTIGPRNIMSEWTTIVEFKIM